MSNISTLGNFSMAKQQMKDCSQGQRSKRVFCE